MPSVRPMSAFSPDSFIVADVSPSPNHNERLNVSGPDLIILHYTGMPTAERRARLGLCREESQVSSHYFVHEDGRVDQLVAEDRRAWHAGQEHPWKTRNRHQFALDRHRDRQCRPSRRKAGRIFPPLQIAAVISLCTSVITRRGPISADRVLGAFRCRAGPQAGSRRKISMGRCSRESGIGLLGSRCSRSTSKATRLQARRPWSCSHRVCSGRLRSYGYGLDGKRHL